MRIFPLLQDPSRVRWVQLVVVAAAVFLLVLFCDGGGLAYLLAVAFALGSSVLLMVLDRRGSVRVELLDSALRVRGDIYGRTWPYADFALEGIRIVNLRRTRDLHPQRKLWGTSLAGYHAGEFRLRNRQSATVFLSAEESVVLLPFRSGSMLMISQDQDFLDALLDVSRSRAPAERAR